MMGDDNSLIDRFLEWVENVAGTSAAMIVCILISFMIVLLGGMFAAFIIKSLKVLLCVA